MSQNPYVIQSSVRVLAVLKALAQLTANGRPTTAKILAEKLKEDGNFVFRALHTLAAARWAEYHEPRDTANGRFPGGWCLGVEVIRIADNYGELLHKTLERSANEEE
jgi:DNA-binding IclR family transcriptional regulator